MKAQFKTVWPYAADAMNLPVRSVGNAIPFYETVMGFRVLSRQSAPVESVVLERDDIKIGLAENGGDPAQEGCFFGVNNVIDAFFEIKGFPPGTDDLRIDKYGDDSYAVFFVIAPDGLCYCIGEKQMTSSG